MDKNVYVECPECGGSGEILTAKLYPTGHTEVMKECKFCDGFGNFPEDEYLIMKLAGEV